MCLITNMFFFCFFFLLIRADYFAVNFNIFRSKFDFFPSKFYFFCSKNLITLISKYIKIYTSLARQNLLWPYGPCYDPRWTSTASNGPKRPLWLSTAKWPLGAVGGRWSLFGIIRGHLTPKQLFSGLTCTLILF